MRSGNGVAGSRGTLCTSFGKGGTRVAQQQLSRNSDGVSQAAAEMLVGQLRAANNAVQGPNAPLFSDADYAQLVAKLEKRFRRFTRLRKPPNS